MISTNKGWKEIIKKKKKKKRKIPYFSHQLQRLNAVIVIMEENMIVIRDPKTFSFNFDLPQNVD